MAPDDIGRLRRIFVSSDDGRSFAQHPAPDGSPITALTFLDDSHALAVAGPTGAPHLVFRTVDGGRTWTPAILPVPRGATPGGLLVGPPSVDGKVLRVPVLVHADDHVRLYLCRSTDGGRTMAAGSALNLAAGEDPGEAFPALNAAQGWLPTGRHLYETVDGGRTWTSIIGAAMPYPLGLRSATTALGVRFVAGCRRGKSDCYSYSYFVRTADAGRSWLITGPT